MLQTRLYLAVLFLYPFFLHTAFALNPAQSIDQYVQDACQSDQGPPQNTVQTIADAEVTNAAMRE